MKFAPLLLTRFAPSQSSTEARSIDRGMLTQRLLVRGLSVALASGLLVSAATVQAEQLAPPTRTDRQATMLVTSLMEQMHLSNHPLDDSRSSRAFDNYVENLDP